MIKSVGDVNFARAAPVLPPPPLPPRIARELCELPLPSPCNASPLRPAAAAAGWTPRLAAAARLNGPPDLSLIGMVCCFFFRFFFYHLF